MSRDTIGGQVDPEALKRHLRHAAMKSFERVFLAQRDQVEFWELALVVRTLEPDVWSRDPTGALLAVMRQAVGSLPEEVPEHSTITWREVGVIIAGFGDPVAVAASPGNTFYQRCFQLGFGKSPYASKKTYQRNVVDPLFGLLTNILSDLYTVRLAVLETLASRVTAAEQASGHEIYREDDVEAVKSLVADGHMVVGIWGEAGVGKTVLAKQVANALTTSKVLVLRAGNEKRQRDDIVNALIAEGVEPAAWSESYCRVELQRILGGRPKSGALVVDDVDDEESLWELIPQVPSIPVIVTSRAYLRSDYMASGELSDFSEQEAFAFVESYLGECVEHELRSFVMTLGCRPLALGHAVLYLRESPEVEMRDLMTILIERVTTGLDLVTLPEQETRSLVRLYEAIITSIAAKNDATARVLDYFLAISGRSGDVHRELLYEFMHNVHGESMNRVRFRSGLRKLADLGLVREEGVSIVMHSLTCRILQDLCAAYLSQIEEDYIGFLLSPDIERSDDPYSGMRMAWILKEELTAGANLMPGWKYIFCIDEYTWLAIKEEADSSASSRTSTVRYDVFEAGVFRTTVRAGRRESVPLAREEARQFYWAAKRYHVMIRVMSVFRDSFEVVSQIVEAMSVDETLGLVFQLPEQKGARLLSWMSDERAAALLCSLTVNEVARDKGARLLWAVEKNHRGRLMVRIVSMLRKPHEPVLFSPN